MTFSSPSLQNETIAILDCGAQYTKVIDRRVRELNVNTEIYPADVDPSQLKHITGIILSGGPHSVYEDNVPHCQAGLFELGVPVLGICYGMQLMTHLLGGTVEQCSIREYGETLIEVEPSQALFTGLASQQQVLMSHGDSVTKLPEGFHKVGASLDGVTAAIAHPQKGFYGVQFHPEVDLTENGVLMLKNFLYEVCKVQGNYTLDSRLDASIHEIQETVGNHPVFVLVSGGVDSAVTAALLVKALGPEQVYAVHIDSGYMRKDESDSVCEALAKSGLTHLKRINAKDAFWKATGDKNGKAIGPLSLATDPEEKRQLIGDTFFHLIQAEMRETLANFEGQKVFLAQGTLRPDLIESGNRDISSSAHTIKTHHNDVDLIRQMRDQGLVIEPNRDWHKDEVRQVGRLLGLPEPIVQRQPFPGPGLAIRVLCANEPFGLNNYDQVNSTLSQKAASSGFQSLLLPIRSVGVQGDGRSYSHLALLQNSLPQNLEDPAAIETWWQHLRELARNIPNQIPAINRMGYVLSPTPLPNSLKTITPTTLTDQPVDLIRELDHLTTTALDTVHFKPGLSQYFCVLLPTVTEEGLAKGKTHSVAIRAIVTADFMTARPAALGKEIPLPLILELAQTLSKHPKIDLVCYDVTSKPPATVEWE